MEIEKILRNLNLNANEKAWIFNRRLRNDSFAYPEIGIDGSVFIKIGGDKTTNVQYYGLVVARSESEAIRKGKIGFIASSASFSYLTALSHRRIPPSTSLDPYNLITVEEFLKDKIGVANNGIEFLFRKLDPVSISRKLYYKRLIEISDAIKNGDLYSLQAAEYLTRAYSLMRVEPSEAILTFF